MHDYTDELSTEEKESNERISQGREQPSRVKFFLLLNLGLILTALGIVVFKAPNHFALGGTSGISIIISTLNPGLPVGAIMWIVNAVLVVLGFIFLDRDSMGWTIFSSFALSAYVSLFEQLIPLSAPLTDDTLLELIFAVMLPAIGSAVFSDWAVEDASFLRMQSATVGYTLPEDLTKKIHIRKLRLYVTGTNLFCLTKYSGYDPEVDTRRSTPLTPGVDYSAYPKSIGFVAGINLTF